MKYFSMFSGIGGFELAIEQAYGVHSEKDSERIWQKNKETIRSKKSECNYEGNSGLDSSETGSCQHHIRSSDRQPYCVGFSEIDKYAIQIYKNHFPERTIKIGDEEITLHKNYGDASGVVPEEIPDFDLLTFGWPCQDNSIAGKRKGQSCDTRSGLLYQAVRILRAKKPKYFIAENVPGLFSVSEGRDFYETIRMFTDSGYDVQWQVLNTRWFLPQNRERIFFVGHLMSERRPEVFPVGEGDIVVNEEGIRLQHPRQTAGALRSTDYKGTHNVIRETALCLDANYYKGLEAHQQRTGVISNDKIRRLVPTECARLQGFPDDWCEDVSDTQAYRCYGNAVSVPVVECIVKKLKDEIEYI
jgi:DNA (cytosine-5)-methyltransferase 1